MLTPINGQFASGFAMGTTLMTDPSRMGNSGGVTGNGGASAIEEGGNGGASRVAQMIVYNGSQQIYNFAIEHRPNIDTRA
jgi:hypothetical protein